MKIKIKNKITGEVIFSHSCEGNTIKITVEEAMKNKVDLSYSDLSKADLSGINLSSANLISAKLVETDLSYANLRGANLYNADLQDADLSHTDLNEANLNYAILRSTDLVKAELTYAKLIIADLYNASLYRAGLRYANLKYAYLNSANLSDANLSYADLRGADLREADLFNADLQNADLSDADVRNANFNKTDLRGAKNIPFIPMEIPDGEIIVWKTLYKHIIKLKLLKDSKRSRATGTKCRCDKALVLAIENLDGTDSGLKEIVNDTYEKCRYKIGEIVYADSFNENRWDEYTHGIHFFMDRQSAVDYS